MALRLRERIEAMHRLGVCHRDLHLANIIVDEDARALIVDPDSAVDVDQSAPCYDLYRPEASGVPVPAEHPGYCRGPLHRVQLRDPRL
jgi:tRNA A-37 threonylcarbamoyl transferase component Bud32